MARDKKTEIEEKFPVSDFCYDGSETGVIPEPGYPDKGSSFSEVIAFFKKRCLLENPGPSDTVASTAN